MLPLQLAKVLVTGASGTLGYNIVHLLAVTHPRTRIVLLMRTPDAALFANCPNVEIRQVDMFDKARLRQSVLEIQPDAIIHCAASGVRPSKIGWFDLIDLNVESTNQLFQASCEVEACHFIHISTGLVYRAQPHPCHEDDPIDTLHPYGASKAAADCLLRAGADRLNRPLTVVRPFSFTGVHDGGDRLFPSLLRAARNRTPLKMSLGTQLRDFCAVQDVAEFLRLLLDRQRCAEAQRLQPGQRAVARAAGDRRDGLRGAGARRGDSAGRASVSSPRAAASGCRYRPGAGAWLAAAHQPCLRRLAAGAVAIS